MHSLTRQLPIPSVCAFGSRSRVALAESGRGGEVRQIGVFENRCEILVKLAARLSKGGRRLSFCYEAGPCGYGLHRLWA